MEEEGADVEESSAAAEEGAPAAAAEEGAPEKKKRKGRGKANTSPQPEGPSRSVRASPMRDAKKMEGTQKKQEPRSKRKLDSVSEASADDLPDTWDDDFDTGLLVCVSVCISMY